MTVNLFISYAHKDQALRDQLDAHLKILQRQGVINLWHDRKIDAGDEWKNNIDKNLETADIILFLISADFLASDYCFDVEVKRAMQRHEAHSAIVIPVMLRPCDFNGFELMKLQGLPKDFKFVTMWNDKDEAFFNIVKGIRRIADARI